MPSAPERRAGNDEHHARLDRIRDLWIELQATDPRSRKYNALVKRIRCEADAFRDEMDAEDPPPLPSD